MTLNQPIKFQPPTEPVGTESIACYPDPPGAPTAPSERLQQQIEKKLAAIGVTTEDQQVDGEDSPATHS